MPGKLYVSEGHRRTELGKVAYKCMADWMQEYDRQKYGGSKYRWDALPDNQQEMWEAIAQAVISRIEQDRKQEAPQ